MARRIFRVCPDRRRAGCLQQKRQAPHLIDDLHLLHPRRVLPVQGPGEALRRPDVDPCGVAEDQPRPLVVLEQQAPDQGLEPGGGPGVG